MLEGVKKFIIVNETENSMQQVLLFVAHIWETDIEKCLHHLGDATGPLASIDVKIDGKSGTVSFLVKPYVPEKPKR